jgi:hypothetical protein
MNSSTIVKRWLCAAVVVVTMAALGAPAFAEESQAELAKKLNNPVADLISVPLQSNWDFGIGPAEDAMRYTLNIQPVIPISISTDWNLITRTILPVIYAESPVPGGPNKGGLGDTVQSLFLSPKAPVGGWIVGAGPVFLWPTATNGLGSQKWGAGPTFVVLKQQSGWTYGMLANQIWSYTGHESSATVSTAFLQPFVSYTTKTYTTLTANTESTFNWKAKNADQQWTVPVNLMVSQLLKIGGRPVSFQLGGRAYADRPSNGPNWGVRFAVAFLFPK